MLPGRLGCRQEPIGDADIAAELNSSRLGIEKSVRPAFDGEAVTPLGPDRAADMVGCFEDGHVGIGSELLQTIREAQAADAGADDDDPGHATIVSAGLSQNIALSQYSVIIVLQGGPSRCFAALFGMTNPAGISNTLRNTG